MWYSAVNNGYLVTRALRILHSFVVGCQPQRGILFFEIFLKLATTSFYSGETAENDFISSATDFTLALVVPLNKISSRNVCLEAD